MSNVILYVGGFKLPDQNSSALRVIGIARLLNNLGYHTLVGGKIYSPFTTYSDIKFWDIEKNNDERIKQGSNIKAITQKINDIGINNIKAIIAYNYAPIAFYKLYRFCKKMNITLIPDITEWYLIDGKISFTKVLRMFLTDWRIKYITPKCNNIIVSTKYLADFYKTKNVITLPVVSNEVEHNPNTILIKNLDRIRFIYAGYPGVNFSKEKVDWIIESFAQLASIYDNFEFHIVGVDKKTAISYKPSLNKEIRKIGERITFYGRKTHSQTIKLLSHSSFLIFVRPINRVTKAGFPGKLKEAFDLGLPVITNNTSDISEYIQNGENGFVFENYDKSELYQTIENILNLSTEEINNIKLSCSRSAPFSQKKVGSAFKKFMENLK